MSYAMMKENEGEHIMKKHILFPFLSLLAVMVLWGLWENQALQITHIPVSSRNLPESFDGFRIAQVSDLHNAAFGENNESLLQKLWQAEPDIIAITGDLIDSQHTDTETALAFVEGAVKIAPCYYVTGNHEARISTYPQFEDQMKALGVTVLRTEAAVLERDGSHITLLGVDDPAFDRSGQTDAQTLSQQLDSLLPEGFTILLSHRPEHFSLYCQYKIELVLSGHAHGGQLRLPLLGGVIAPHQGFFPKYDSGLYTASNTSMVVSRGLGNSLFPFRLNNPPEIVCITLHNWI